MKLQKKYLLMALLTFIAGFFADKIAGSYFSKKPEQLSLIPVRQEGFKYISPLLYCDSTQQSKIPSLDKLHAELERFIEESTQQQKSQLVSVYMRIPATGEWIAINEEEKYTPASLLKLPILIAYYKAAEKNQNALSQVITYNGDTINTNQNIEPGEVLTKGETYTADQLLTHMITYSDNASEETLLNNISQQEFDRVFSEVNIGHLDYSKIENFMDVVKYATFFRALYNASYLNRDMSERALSLLTKVQFKDGITAGIPKNIPVAHKFGERAYDNSNLKQLHDCGIVYYPKNPYLLCVMTKGYSFDDLSTIIKTISSKTYEAVKGLEPQG
ncbi:MAG: serine hydrolase [Candidatus Levyibacteriota bacterium]